jgi:hypothetical protein
MSVQEIGMLKYGTQYDVHEARCADLQLTLGKEKRNKYCQENVWKG